jgi:hypothetical protein
VLSKEDEATSEFVVETNPTKGQLRGEDQILIHPEAGRKPFVLGEPLMRSELVEMLPRGMRELYKWYLKATADGDVMFAARVMHTNLYRGFADIWIVFMSLWFLYHQEALDKSPISAFVM